MKEEIEKANKKIAEHREIIRSLEQFVSAAQKICEHDWQFDYMDYHNRIDHEKCTICGAKR